ncbi:MAG TPA: chitobiase/beta-hexosaminidase C-terminal domain-containing protein [Opitutaceae bacterium]|nr:chitobiase/beta-hexosaminidase C-terminal domain-containing protein [Opitutaceae bacterium]
MNCTPLKSIAAGVLSLLAVSAYAQIGSGWTPSDETFKIQTSGSGKVNGDTFSLTSTSSGTKDRAEREYLQYTSGTHQFQGDFTVVSFGGTNICIKQTFHVNGGPWQMLAVKNNNTFYEVSTGKALGSFTIGTSYRINTITDMSAHTVVVYINGQVVETLTNGQSPIYDKCGTYRTNSGSAPITATWHNVHLWQGGRASGGGGGGSVTAPAFSPAGGTYTSAQSVSISDSTSGASIRYTTNGSTPSETSGTVYSSPVYISATTTLKAIAYKSGSSDSSVTSATYTITAVPPPTLNFEAESLSYTGSGATTSVQTDANSSGGKWVELAGNSTGDHIDFTVPNVPAGTYQLKMEWKGNASRGILQLSVDGTNLGPTLDQYSAAQTYPTTTFGNVTFSAAGNHTIRLTVTGKNSKSSSYQLSADKFTLAGQ